ncbi:unnamed protein product, partial [Meganyctiphanes norvegica]
TEIKEEVKDELVSVPLGPDDPMDEEDNSWEEQRGGAGGGEDQDTPSNPRSFMHTHPHLHPQPGGHPPVLPLGLFRVPPHANYSMSGGVQWEGVGQMSGGGSSSQSPDNHNSNMENSAPATSTASPGHTATSIVS